MDDLPLPASRAAFDQQPIGNTNKLLLDEYPPDFDPSKIQTKAEPLPLGKRLGSKVFKVKKQAMEELLKIVTNQNHKEFREHEVKIVEGIADSNPQCQILAAKILFQYLEKEGVYDLAKQSQKKSFAKNVIQKLLVIEREQAQNVGMDILFWLMDHQHQEYLTNELNEYLLNKNPKIVAVTFRVLQSLVHNYGPKRLGDLEMFFKNLKMLAEPLKPTAKPQMIQFFQELFKWMGENVFNSFVLHKECKDQVMKWSKTYERQPMEIKRGLKKGEVAKKVIPMDEDQEQDSTPVDVLPHYDSRWVDTVLAIEKWQEKKQHLEDFIKKTNVRNIVPRENSHYIGLLKRLFQDNNINLLQCGFKIVKNLCRGLKRAFSLSCKAILPYIYLRLKDNKVLIVDQTLATLKAMTASIGIEDLQKEIVEALRDKSPQMRLNTLKLLKEVSAKKEPKTSKILKSMLTTLIALTNDSSSDVRDVALSVLCKIKEQHGMIFFEDRLESLPAKKLNIIRSTPTPGNTQNDKPQIEQNSYTYFQKTNSKTSQASTKNNTANNRENKIMQQQKKQPNSLHSEPKMGMNKNQVKNPEKSLEKKPSYTVDTKQNHYQKEIANVQLPTIREETHSYRENHNDSAERQLMQIREQEWPIVPKKEHVHRLTILFNKLGEPFATLATPFRLTVADLEVLENADNSFMIDNADLLLKWALWKIQTQKLEIIDKITSVVIHLIYLLKTKMTDSLTILIMSIISNLLESEFGKNDVLRCINTSIMEISKFLREKVFNFWMTTLNESSNNPEFCQKILNLLQSTFASIDIENEEIVAMARVEPILRSKSFMAFLLTKKTKSYLKVYGFKFVDNQKPQPQFQWLLRQSESDFAMNIRVEERIYFFDIFKKMSHEATEELINIQQRCDKSQIINTHIKIMDSVMLGFLDQSLQSINMHNYLSRLTGTLTQLEECHITPYLRNLLRLTMFFLVDVSLSRLEDKDQLTKATNKIVLIILDKVPADHLLEVMGMLLRYSYAHNYTNKICQLLTKCMSRTTKNTSFANKANKNVKGMFNFMISFIEEFKIQDQDPIMKPFVEMFNNMMTQYKELCYENVIEKLNYFNGSFTSQIILDMFNRFMNKPEKTQKQAEISNKVEQFNSMNNQGDSGVMENNSLMSNLPQKFQYQKNSLEQNQPMFNQQQNMVIREATNIPRKEEMKPQSNTNVDLLGNEGPKIKEQRRRIQDYTGLCQSFIELTRMQDQFNGSLSSNNMNAQPTTTQNENEPTI